MIRAFQAHGVRADAGIEAVLPAAGDGEARSSTGLDGRLGEPSREPRRSRLVVNGRRLDAEALRACQSAAAAA